MQSKSIRLEHAWGTSNWVAAAEKVSLMEEFTFLDLLFPFGTMPKGKTRRLETKLKLQMVDISYPKI